MDFFNCSQRYPFLSLSLLNFHDVWNFTDIELTGQFDSLNILKIELHYLSRLLSVIG